MFQRMGLDFFARRPSAGCWLAALLDGLERPRNSRPRGQEAALVGGLVVAAHCRNVPFQNCSIRTRGASIGCHAPHGKQPLPCFSAGRRGCRDARQVPLAPALRPPTRAASSISHQPWRPIRRRIKTIRFPEPVSSFDYPTVLSCCRHLRYASVHSRITGSGPSPRRRWLRDAVVLPPFERGEPDVGPGSAPHRRRVVRRDRLRIRHAVVAVGLVRLSLRRTVLALGLMEREVSGAVTHDTAGVTLPF